MHNPFVISIFKCSYLNKKIERMVSSECGLRVFSKKDLDVFLKEIEPKQSQGSGSVWVIRLSGKIFTVSSGKCGWSKLHHAKAALKLDCGRIVGFIENKYGYKTYKESLKLWNDYIEFLQEQGVLEFVEFK